MRVGPDRLAEAANEGSSISVDGSSGSATLKGLNGICVGLLRADTKWLIDSGYALGRGFVIAMGGDGLEPPTPCV